MFFKNAQVYRLAKDWDITVEALEEQLGKKAFHPCGSQDMESRGWVSPNKTEARVVSVGGHWLVALGFEHRMLPSAVVKQETEERAEAMAGQQAGLPQLRVHHQSSSSSSSVTAKPSSAARNSSDVAASSRLVLMLVLMDLSSRMRLSAMWRTSARLWAM